MLFKRFVELYFNKKSIKKNLIVSGGKSIKSPLSIINKINKNEINVYLLDERETKISRFKNHSLIKKVLKKNVDISKLDKRIKKKKNMTSLIKKLKHSKTLTIMGMGKDGHIASIFPQSIKFKKMIDIKKKPNIVFTDKAGDPFCKRLTMNLSMILLSNKIIVVLKDKNRIKFFLKYLKEENKKTPIYHLAKKAKSKLAFFFNKEIISIKELEKRLV